MPLSVAKPKQVFAHDADTHDRSKYDKHNSRIEHIRRTSATKELIESNEAIQSFKKRKIRIQNLCDKHLEVLPTSYEHTRLAARSDYRRDILLCRQNQRKLLRDTTVEIVGQQLNFSYHVREHKLRAHEHLREAEGQFLRAKKQWDEYVKSCHTAREMANEKLQISSSTMERAKQTAREHIESSEVISLRLLQKQLAEASARMNSSIASCAASKSRTMAMCEKHEKELNAWKTHLNDIEEKYEGLTEHFKLSSSMLEIDSRQSKFTDVIQCKNVEKTYTECAMAASHQFEEIRRISLLDHSKHQSKVVTEANKETTSILNRYLKVQVAATGDKKAACSLIDEMAENKTNYWSTFIKSQSKHDHYIAKLSTIKMNVDRALEEAKEDIDFKYARDLKKAKEKYSKAVFALDHVTIANKIESLKETCARQVAKITEQIGSLENDLPSLRIKEHEETCTGDLVFSSCHTTCDRTCHDTKERCTNKCWRGCGCPADKPFRGDGAQHDRCFSMLQCEQKALESEMEKLEHAKPSSSANTFEKQVFEATKKSLKEASQSTAKTMGLLRGQ